ncbi:MAG: hypothetical protein GTO14_11715 [Anaerolineales bacterium]|nr:hypothetical protein [Anaerolineales bacterium]
MSVKDRWETVLSSAGLHDPGGQIFIELEGLYSEPHRKYHNMKHVTDSLQHLDANPLPGTNAIALEIAIWFHDAIYTPLRGNNEWASAELATQRLSELGADNRLQQTVHRLIMVTAHTGQPTDLDESLMADIDLAILGSDRETFETYEYSIRREYRLVPGPIYRRKRKAILQSFLSRSSIYNTSPFIDAREDLARSNLKWAISRL